MNGLTAAKDAGFSRTRINAVLLKDVPADERVDLVEYCWNHGYTPRFIEMMPVGNLDYQTDHAGLTSADLIEELSQQYTFELDSSAGGLGGPSKYWVVQAGAYRGMKVGTISPMSDNHFCGTCNRARLTVRGGFRGCLGSDNEVQLLQDIRNESKSACLAQVKRALGMKLPSHLMSEPNFVPLSAMTGIGG